MATKSSKSNKSSKNLSKSTKPSTKASGTKSKKDTASTEISTKQWKMPAGYSSDGTKMANLREVVDPNVPTLSLSELSPDQRVDLVAKRIEAQPEFQIAMIGAGILDKERAITEVKGQTKIGRALMEIEQRVITNLIDKATKDTTPK